MGMKIKVIFLIFYVSIFISAKIAIAGLVYFENFDDQDLDNSVLTGSVGYGEDGSPDGYTTGYGGTGYAPYRGLTSANCTNDDKEPVIVQWSYGAAWTSNEVYFSYFVKWVGYTDTDLGDNENLKQLYIHIGPNFSSGYVHINQYTEGDAIFWSSYDKNHENYDSGWGRFTNIDDGNWHQIETYLNIATGVWQVWFDGVLIIDNDYVDSRWSGSNIADITGPSIWAGTGCTAAITQQIVDNWEVWDSLPSDAPGHIPAGTSEARTAAGVTFSGASFY